MPTRRSLLLSAAAAALASPALAINGDALAEKVRSFGRLNALGVLKDGEVVLAEAPNGHGLDRPANVKSVSKSIVSLLLGAAIDRGHVPDVRATIGDLAPDLIPRGADPRVASITVEDLVTLRAGLDRTSGPNYGAWVSSRNWVADALSRPMIAEPGGRMLYSTGSTRVLGAVLAHVSGQSLLSLAREWLGTPLEIEIAPWTRDPQGFYMGGNEMALSPMAMARVGELVRQRGEFGGTRVISEGWIDASLRPATRSPFSGLEYGYGWFLGRANGTPYALARGFGGQVIAVAPGKGLTVAITSDPTIPARSGGYFGDLRRMIEDDIIGTI